MAWPAGDWFNEEDNLYTMHYTMVVTIATYTLVATAFLLLFSLHAFE